MFLNFFSLSHNPFRTRASGTDVFVGPQLAAVTTAIQRSLVERDAVCVVMGPVGAGKTVAVSRGLTQLAAKHVVVKIGRVRLGRDELLEALINGLGGDDTLTSTPRRIEELGRLLRAHEDEESRVIVAVEDAVRLGLEGLIELEALTSADTGESSGANLVLMGSPELHELLESSELARLKQRVSGRQTIAEFSLGETQGYVTARVRAAGGSAETLFPGDAVIALHEHSGGIARVINRLGGAVLRAAADAGQPKVSMALVGSVAEGKPAESGVDNAPANTAAVSAPDLHAEVPSADEDDGSVSAEPAEDAASIGPAELDAAQCDGDSARKNDDVPELIHDTLPEFAALKLPEGDKTTADLVAELRDITDGTQPALPVLRSDPAGPDEATPINDEAAPEVMAPAAMPADESASPTPEQPENELPSTLAPLAEPPAVPDDVPSPAALGEAEPAVMEPAGTRADEPASPSEQPENELPSVLAPMAEPPAVADDVPSLEALSQAAPSVAEEAASDAAAALTSAAVDAELGGAISEETERQGAPANDASEVDEVASNRPIAPEPPPMELEEPVLFAAEGPHDDGTPELEEAPEAAPAAHPQPPAASEAGSADTQTIKALDSALLPDTALLAALGDSASDAISEPANGAGPSADAIPESLPTLSASMRLEPETANPPAASTAEPLGDGKPIELAPEPDDNALASGETPVNATPDVPEITLDDSIRGQQEALQARRDAEAAEREAAERAEAEKLKPSPAELAAAAERAAEKERLADMPSIVDQFDDNAELPPNDKDPQDDERVKLEELADQLGGATSLEEVDEAAAETLFGVEFSQLANTVTAKALEGPSAPEEQSAELKLALEPEPEADLVAAVAAPASPPPNANPNNGANGTTASPQPNIAANGSAARQTPEPGSLPDLDSSAARRLEMVRSLNGKTGPVVPPPNTAEEIVLGEAAPTPQHDGPSPDPIEDQFGTSMTANLKALSMQNVKEMQQAEEEQQEKKRGFLSRFKRS